MKLKIKDVDIVGKITVQELSMIDRSKIALERGETKLSRIYSDEFWMFYLPLYITITLKSGVRLVFTIKKGHCTDFASVPKRLRSLIGNTDYNMRIAAIVHDILYESKFFGKNFKAVNKLFKQLILDRGLKNANTWKKRYRVRRRARWAYFSVQYFSKRLYDSYPDRAKGNAIYENEFYSVYWC